MHAFNSSTGRIPQTRNAQTQTEIQMDEAQTTDGHAGVQPWASTAE